MNAEQPPLSAVVKVVGAQREVGETIAVTNVLSDGLRGWFDLALDVSAFAGRQVDFVIASHEFALNHMEKALGAQII